MIGHLDCSSGVSGDKFLGAILDVGTRLAEQGRPGFTAADLQALVAKLAPEARVHVERTASYGIGAIGVRVVAEGQPHSRTWTDVRSLLQDSDLDEAVRAPALRAFEALAVAEAHVHGKTPDSVHFHEVGAIDSITDVVGVCAGLHALGIERLISTPIAVGWGTVETSHGTLPVPAPATAELLAAEERIPVVSGSAGGEMTTPTGATLVGTLVAAFGPVPPMHVIAQGFGSGTRDIGSVNVCRLLVGRPMEGGASAETARDQAVVIETNIDHLTAEQLAFVAEELLGEGALDVWQTPIVMKKGRAAVMLSVLTEPASAESFARRIVDLTGSLGVRFLSTDRLVAERAVHGVQTPWGLAHVKVGAGRVRPEHSDVARITRRTGRPFDEVAREIAQQYARQADEDEDDESPR